MQRRGLFVYIRRASIRPGYGSSVLSLAWRCDDPGDGRRNRSGAAGHAGFEAKRNTRIRPQCMASVSFRSDTSAASRIRPILLCSDGAWSLLYDRNRMKTEARKLIESENFEGITGYLKKGNGVDDCSFLALQLENWIRASNIRPARTARRFVSI